MSKSRQAKQLERESWKSGEIEITWNPAKNLLAKINRGTVSRKATGHVQKSAISPVNDGNCYNKGETMTFKSSLIKHTKKAVKAVRAGDTLSIARKGLTQVDVKATKNGLKIYNKATGSVTYFDSKSAAALAEVVTAITA